MHVDELTARAPNPESEPGHSHGCHHNGSRDRPRRRGPSNHKDQRRQCESGTAHPYKLLSGLFVLMEDALLNDSFDSFFFGAAGVDREKSRPEEQGLKEHDAEPSARASAAGPDRPRQAPSDKRHQDGESQGKMNDGGVQRQ
jgi:hypothetical protein